MSVIASESEKRLRDLQRNREKVYAIMFSGRFMLKHEEGQELFRWTPPVWLHEFLRDWCMHPAHRSLTLKGRQIYMTSLICCLLLAIARFQAGKFCQISNRSAEDAKGTLLTRVVEPFHQTWPNFPPDMVNISAERIEFLRKEGNSQITGGGVSGMGQTPYMAVFTEWPSMCAADPSKARKYISSVVEGAEFASFVLEGAASLAGEMAAVDNMLDIALDRQRCGHKATRKDFTAYFNSWHCKPELSISNDQWGNTGRKIKPYVLDYFKSLEGVHEHMIGRRIIKGGMKFTEGQKRWYFLACENTSPGDVRGMFGNYPSLLSESMQSGSDALYLKAFIQRARDDGRISEYAPLPHTPVYCCFDIGWQDETVCVYAQSNGDSTWRVLGGWAANHWTSENIISRILEADYESITNRRPFVVLPHDGTHKSAAAERITGRKYGKVIEDMRAARKANGQQAFNVLPAQARPSLESEIFATMREAMPRLQFAERECEKLLLALGSARIMKTSKDGLFADKLADTPGRHWHSACAVLAYQMSAQLTGTANDAELSAYWNAKPAAGPVNYGL